jgi:ABC-type transporter Mla subunit MlaD
MVLAAIVILAILILWISNYTSRATRPVYVELASALNVVEGTPVVLGGAKAGWVDRFSLKVDDKTRRTVVRLQLRVYDEVFTQGYAHTDASAGVSSDVFGNTRVLIEPGSPDLPALEEGVTLRASKSASVEEVMVSTLAAVEKVAAAAEKIGAVAANVNEVVGDPGSKENLRKILEEGRKFVESDLREAVNHLDRLVEENRAGVSSSVEQFNKFGEKLLKVADSLDRVVTRLEESIDTVETDIRKVVGGVDGIVTENREGIRDSVKSLWEASATLKENLDGLIEEYQGAGKSLKQTLADNKDEVSAILEKLEKASRNLETFSETVSAYPWQILWKENGPAPLPDVYPEWKAPEAPPKTEEPATRAEIGPVLGPETD